MKRFIPSTISPIYYIEQFSILFWIGGIFMSNLQVNYSSLKQRFPHVRTKMEILQTAHPTKPSVCVEMIDRDLVWLQAVKSSINNCKIVFVYGFGRGFSIADLIEQYPDCWFFVYEPDENLFFETLSEYDISFILDHPNFYWLSVGESQLNMLFHMVCSYMQDEMVFVALRHYLENDMDILRGIKQKFMEYRDTFYSNKHTEHRFREEWTRNYLYHVIDVLNTPSIEQLFYSFEGSTAVIVSSGPSLQEDIEYLRKIQQHALIIAAGSSIQALIKHGIRPHLTVIMDGHPINKQIFSTPESLEAPLLFTSSSYYEISDLKHTKKIHSIMKSDAISQYLLEYSREQLFVSPTATVAGTAIQAAVCLGAKRIILAGQDLSFPDQKFYTDGIEHFSSDSTDEKVQIAHKKVLNVKGTYNSTDDSFLLMKDGIENLITGLPRVEFINTTRNGAVIEGAAFKPIDELYEQLQSERVGLDAIGDWIENNHHVVDNSRMLYFKEKLELILLDLLNVRSEIRTIMKHLNKIRELSRIKPIKAQRELELIEQMWGAIATRGWFAPIVESILPLQIAKFDQLLPTIITEQNLIRKTDLICEHLGSLLTEIDDRIPDLEDMFTESILRFNK